MPYSINLAASLTQDDFSHTLLVKLTYDNNPTVYYDPSYGLTHTDRADFESNAVAGFVYEDRLPERAQPARPAQGQNPAIPARRAVDFDQDTRIGNNSEIVFLFRAQANNTPGFQDFQ